MPTPDQIEQRILRNLASALRKGKQVCTKADLLRGVRASRDQIAAALNRQVDVTFTRPKHGWHSKRSPVYTIREGWTAEAVEALARQLPLPEEQVPKREGRSMIGRSDAWFNGE